MLTRVAVMESDSANETKSVTEITPPKKLKQSTIVYSLVPNLLVVQVLWTASLQIQSPRDIERVSIITALYTGLTIIYSLANLL